MSGAVEDHLAGRQFEQPGDAAGQGRLPASGLTDQAQGLAASYLEADPVHGVHEVLAATHASRTARETT